MSKKKKVGLTQDELEQIRLLRSRLSRRKRPYPRSSLMPDTLITEELAILRSVKDTTLLTPSLRRRLEALERAEVTMTRPPYISNYREDP